jgi:hypothetical protein
MRGAPDFAEGEIHPQCSNRLDLHQPAVDSVIVAELAVRQAALVWPR